MACRTIFLCLGLLVSTAGIAIAQTFPAKPIRVIVAYPPGGSTDIIARILGQKLTDRFGQTMLVDNRAGLGGIIGSQIGAKAAPDGYTLIVGQIGTHASANVLYKNLGYDQLRDFVPISLRRAAKSCHSGRFITRPKCRTGTPCPSTSLRETSEFIVGHRWATI